MPGPAPRALLAGRVAVVTAAAGTGIGFATATIDGALALQLRRVAARVRVASTRFPT